MQYVRERKDFSRTRLGKGEAHLPQWQSRFYRFAHCFLPTRMSTFLALSRARERISLNSLSSEQAAAVAGTGVALAGIYLIATRGGGRGTAGKALAPAPDAGANKALDEPSASGALHVPQPAPEATTQPSKVNPSEDPPASRITLLGSALVG